jgi:hypothetical protein
MGGPLAEVVLAPTVEIRTPQARPVGKRGTEVEDSLAWLDADPQGWRRFLDAVEWSFDAPDLQGVRQAIRNRLSVRESARHPPGDTLLTGAGGSGKTRLLIEWCRRLRYQGWHAGFLRSDRRAADLDPARRPNA